MQKAQFGSGISADTSSGPSARLWGKCPVLDMILDPGVGVYMFDDFTMSPTLTTGTITTEIVYGHGYKAFGESPSTIISVNPAMGGYLELLMSDDNEACSLATISAPFKIINGGGDVWFETRIKSLNVTNDTLGFIVGLAALETLANDIPIVDAGTLATTTNFVGFFRPEGDGDGVDAIYQADTRATATVNADAATMTADTFVKLGFHYSDADRKLRYFVNGVKAATDYTVLSTAGNPFPNDVQLGFICSILGANAADASVTMDWWRAAQLRTA